MKPKMEAGVYVSRTGSLRVLTYKTDGSSELDKGVRKKIMLGVVMLKFPIVESASPGWPHSEFGLKNCEYLGEL